MKALVVDDEKNVRGTLLSFLELRAWSAFEAASPEEAWKLYTTEKPDLVLIDVFLGESDGRELLGRILDFDPAACVVMISGQAELRIAVEAVRSGAYDFLEKPIENGRLEAILRHITERKELAGRVDGLEREWLNERLVLGSSPMVRTAFELAARAADSKLSILIQGPSGCGKELLARYIRIRSKRAGGPFVVANCAAIPAELFESELFGVRKGAYTGAVADRSGYFGGAEGGTLFLDEIGELPPLVQPKLLRAIEYGEIQPLGAGSPLSSDVRLICATNRKLEAETANGRFREDLYYRIAQIVLQLPSLASRREDVPSLAAFFLARASAASERRFASDAEHYLQSKAWPGNIRELRNYVESCAVLIESPLITKADIDAMELQLGLARPHEAPPVAVPRSQAAADMTEELGQNKNRGDPYSLLSTRKLNEARENFDRVYIREALNRYGGVAAAAEALGLLPNNLSRLIRKLGIKR